MADYLGEAVLPVDGVTAELHHDGYDGSAGVHTASVTGVSEDLVVQGEARAVTVGKPLVDGALEVAQQVLCELYVALAKPLGEAREDFEDLADVWASAQSDMCR